MSDKSQLAALRDHFMSFRLERMLSGLQNPLHLMNTGAHPDDEHSALLAWLRFARGLSISTLSATRGQGGQNRIGPERGALLGLIRTHEMHEAAALLEADHFWLDRGYDDPLTDFGFSKSGSDTLNRWGGEEVVIYRMVMLYRRHRPDIILPTFLDVPGQHGHHRAMTQVALKAVDLAADTNYFCEDLPCWTISKVYLPAWSGGGDTYDDEEPPPPATLILCPKGHDPWTGASWTLIGEASRLSHASQDMGDPSAQGRELWPLHLLGGAQEQDIFQGLPERYGALPDAPKALQRLDVLLTECVDLRGQPLVNLLCDAAQLLREVKTSASASFKAAQDHRLCRLEKRLHKALFLAKDLYPSQLAASTSTLSKGQSSTFNFEPPLSPLVTVKLHLSQDFQITKDQEELIAISDQPTPPFAPHYRALGGNGPAYAQLHLSEAGQDFTTDFDFADPISIRPSSLSDWRPAPFYLHQKGQDQSWQLDLPAGYEIDLPPNMTYARGTLCAKADLAEGHSCLRLHKGGQALLEQQMARRADGSAVFLYKSLCLNVISLDLTLPQGRIAYLAGSDDLSSFFSAMGLAVDHLTAWPDAEKLSLYDSLVIGAIGLGRHAPSSQDIKMLTDWVRAGGNLVTFYQRPDQGWPSDGLGLAHLRIGQPSLRWRVTDPKAEVTWLAPNHPLLHQPNSLNNQDFEDWDKERGLYFASAWDGQYQPLFAMADAGEKPLFGGLLSGEFGKGRHSHVALNLTHQLQKNHGGALRLLANLMHWPKCG